MVLIKQIVDI